MKLDLSNDLDVKRAKNYLNKLLTNKKKIELKEVKFNRSTQQNRALHLYYTIISNELNELGLEFEYNGVKGTSLSIRYTTEIVKNFIWRPIQLALFNVKSTTKINTKEINEIVEVISKYFAEKGIELHFPSIESLMLKNK